MDHATHTVFNQPPPLEDYNVFAVDRPLIEALRREGAEWAEERARAFGEIVGRRETIAWGFRANENRPVLRTHDRAGNRIDEVEFHPSWHSLMSLAVEHGLHALPGSSRGRERTRPGRRCSIHWLRSRREWDARCP